MERNPSGGPSVMSWGGIGINQRINQALASTKASTRHWHQPDIGINRHLSKRCRGRRNGVTKHRYNDLVFTKPNRPIFRRHGNTILQQNKKGKQNSTPCGTNAGPSSTLMEDTRDTECTKVGQVNKLPKSNNQNKNFDLNMRYTRCKCEDYNTPIRCCSSNRR